MSDERRREQRIRVRMDARVRYRGAETAAEVFNLSYRGALLVTPLPLVAGELLTAWFPRLELPLVGLRVVRARPVGYWTAVAVAFETPLPAALPLASLAELEESVTPEGFFKA